MSQSKTVADVLIVGSGASGGPCAWHLSQVPGIKIVCLEQGDWPGTAPGTPREADTQRQRLATPPPPTEGVRHFRDGYPYDFTNSALGAWPILGNAVGGATVHYAASWQRLHPSDFLARSLEGVADDWPITYWDLEPYYDQIDRIVGVSGVPGNPAYPRRKSDADLQPPPPLSRAAHFLAGGFKKLGWHWWPAERAIITKTHKGRKPCPAHCEACDDGCPHEAKNSADVVFWPEAIKNGVDLRTRARVREITVDSRGLADGALYYDKDGKLAEQKARLVIVACNGIGTPRLLLNSKSKHFPNGLANSSGQVGKCLMAHPSARVIGRFQDGPLPANDRASIGLVSDQFYEGRPERGFARGMWVLAGGLGAPIASALGEGNTPAATIIPAALRQDRTSRGAVRWGALHRAKFQEQFSRTVSLTVFADELPVESNRIELHPTLVDEVGIPGVKLSYKRTENSDKILAFGMERMKEVLQAAGATEITGEMGTAAPGHYMGTARMGSNPERSVTDKFGRAHDVKNLFVIDGSAFTTGGSLVPTATIHANALRVADYIKTNARNLLKG